MWNEVEVRLRKPPHEQEVMGRHYGIKTNKLQSHIPSSCVVQRLKGYRQ